MPTPRLTCLFLLASLSIGCGGDTTPTAILQSVGDLKSTINEIVAELEAGDIAGVDEVMHRKGFKTMLDSLELLSKQPALGAAGRQSVDQAREKIMTELQAIHKAAPAHGGGGMEAIDVSAAKTNLTAALAELEKALPAGWTLPAASHDHAEHGEEDHAGHDHAAGDHDAHAAEQGEDEEGGHGHAEEGHAEEGHNHSDEAHDADHDETHSAE